jgi:hypothetical protein
MEKTMKRPFTFLALASLVLSMIGTASAADLYQLLPGVWNADNCDICKLNVINSGGYLYADMNDWGTWGYSYSGGYQPIEVVSDDTFFYRGDYFQFYYYGGSQFRVENISNGGDRNVAGANRYDYYPVRGQFRRGQFRFHRARFHRVRNHRVRNHRVRNHRVRNLRARNLRARNLRVRNLRARNLRARNLRVHVRTLLKAQTLNEFV